jgi:hypothetical protein
MNGRGERDNHLILLGPEVGYHQTHAHTIKGLPSAVDVSTLQPALTEKKRSRSASPRRQERDLYAPRAWRLFPSGCCGVLTYQEAAHGGNIEG